MGLLTALGSLARVLGPIVISFIYNGSGLYWTAGFIIITMCVGLAINVATYRVLVPLSVPSAAATASTGHDNQAYDSRSVKSDVEQ